MPRTKYAVPAVAVPLTSQQRNDTRDIDPYELKLIRAGHAVWALYRREKPELGGYPGESGPLWEALQTIWGAKEAYRAELKVRRAEESAKVRERFRALKGK
jgi:hypothetical protein